MIVTAFSASGRKWQHGPVLKSLCHRGTLSLWPPSCLPKVAEALDGKWGVSDNSNKSTRHGSKDKCLGKNIETLSRHAEMGLGKTRLTESLTWWVVWGQQKSVYRYFNSKRKIRENVHLLLKWSRGPADRRHGKCHSAQCLLHLDLYW